MAVRHEQAVAPAVGLQLTNPVAGSSTVFRATAAWTAGAYVEVQQTFRPHSPKPPLHLHPEQHEHFTVLSGRLHAIVGHVERDLYAVEVLEVPRGVPHRMWGAADEATVVIWRTAPALRTDQMHCDLWKAAAQTDFQPDPMRAYEVVVRYGEEFQLC
jgi:mannose-6-phosphate isomerase-like protein (cupin superfamily)